MLTFEELVSYFCYAQAGLRHPYSKRDFVHLIEELGLERANSLRYQIVQQLTDGRQLVVIQAHCA